MLTTTRRPLVAGLVVAALVLSACGTRVDHDEAERAQSAQVGTGPGLGELTSGGDDTGGPADGDGATDDDPAEDGADAPVMFGTLESPCGPGDAAGETDIGVYDDRIEIATISDPGGPIPGLNQALFDSMEAFVQWCNDQGGVNGRRLELTLLDAKLVEYRERALEACDFAFALVGDGGVLDDQGAQDLVDCGLPSVPGYTVSPERADSDLMVQAMPNPPDYYKTAAGSWIAEEFPEVVDKAASVWSSNPITETQALRHNEGYEKLGFDFTYLTATNINEVNYGPVILAMKDAGVEYFTFTSTWEELVNLQRQMRDQGFQPTVVDLETNMYTPAYLEAGGEAIEGSLIRTALWPFEEADENPAMSSYLEILREVKGDVEPLSLGVQSFSSGLLFATALKELGSDVTREGLMEELHQTTSWDGGGLHGESNPGENIPTPCFIVLEVRDGEFQRRHPTEGYDCPEDGYTQLDGDYGSGARVGGS